jgi:hypothetical protein
VGKASRQILDKLDLKHMIYPICQKLFEKKLQKRDINHIRRKNYVVCTTVAHCLPNSLETMILENIEMSFKR